MLRLISLLVLINLALSLNFGEYNWENELMRWCALTKKGFENTELKWQQYEDGASFCADHHLANKHRQAARLTLDRMAKSNGPCGYAFSKVANLFAGTQNHLESIHNFITCVDNTLKLGAL